MIFFTAFCKLLLLATNTCPNNGIICFENGARWSGEGKHHLFDERQPAKKAAIKTINLCVSLLYFILHRASSFVVARFNGMLLRLLTAVDTHELPLWPAFCLHCCKFYVMTIEEINQIKSNTWKEKKAQVNWHQHQKSRNYCRTATLYRI